MIAWRKWLVWVVGLYLLATACSSSDKAPDTAAAAGSSNMESACRKGDFKECYDVPEHCGSGSSRCVAGSPNKWGPCICDNVQWTKVGPYSANDGIFGLVAGNDAFYWAEYVFIIGEAYSRIIVSSPPGSPGKVLVDVPAKVGGIAVHDGNIYVTAGDVFVYSPDGKLLKKLNRDGTPIVTDSSEGGAGGASSGEPGSNGGAPASPGGTTPSVDTSRIHYTDNGLLLDGETITGKVSSFQVVDNGVYYVEYNAAEFLEYLSFDTPDHPQSVASLGIGSVFLDFEVNGNDLYAVVLEDDRVTQTVYSADISVIGK